MTSEDELRERIKEIYPHINISYLDLMSFESALAKKVLQVHLEDIGTSFLEEYKKLSEGIDYASASDFENVMMSTFTSKFREITEATHSLAVMYLNGDIELNEIDGLIPKTLRATKNLLS